MMSQLWVELPVQFEGAPLEVMAMVNFDPEVDPIVRRPLETIRSQPVPAAPVAFDISQVKVPPLFSVRPATVRLPTVAAAVPGAILPPLLTVVEPREVALINDPPEFMVTALPVFVPERTSVPPLIVVAPEWPLFPERTSVPEPFFVSAPLVEAEVPEMVSVVVALLTLITLVVEAVRVKLRSVEAFAPV